MDSIFMLLKNYYNNSDFIYLAKNNKSESRHKHLNLKYLTLSMSKQTKVFIEHISIELMIIYHLTKDMLLKLFTNL